MAVDLIGDALGGTEERAHVEAPEALATAEAFAAALVANASRLDPGVARRTEDFLADQSRLLKIQADGLESEHVLRLNALRGQAIESRIRRFSFRLRVAFQLLMAVVLTALAALVAAEVVNVVSSRNVVIDRFETPPVLAADGLSGVTVAGGLLDELQRIQSATRAAAKARALSNAWTNQIEVQIPQTGVSIAEVERLLRARFGRDQHIGGDLVRARAGGLALTVRGDRILPRTFTDPSGDLAGLLRQAGEYVYGQSQPELWLIYLTQHDRDDEAIQFARDAYPSASPEERPFLLNRWGDAITDKGGPGTMREALPLWQEAVRLKPDYWQAYNNVMFGLIGVGDEEGAARAGAEMVRLAGGRPGRAPEFYYQNYDGLVWDLAALRAETIADIQSHGGLGTNTTPAGPENLNLGVIEIYMHDRSSAALRLQITAIDRKSAADVAEAALLKALLAEEDGDFRAAARAWDAYAAADADPVVSTANPEQMCAAAPTYEKTHQPAKADAALAAVGALTYVDCYRFRGDVLDLRGDWAGAQAWYAAAVRLTPSLPVGYYSWGLALARRGDLAGAAAKFDEANRKGPHWADPLKAWGDVLARQGRGREALAKYDEALKYAPAWRQLRAARAAVAGR